MCAAEVEGKHGRIHLHGAHRNITPAFASLSIRVPEWEARIAKKPHLLNDTVLCFQKVKKRGRLAERLGLLSHPKVLTAMSVLPNHTNNASAVGLATASVMYANDDESKFDKMVTARRSNKRASAREASQRASKVAQGVPAPATYRNMVMRAQLEHFQAVHARGRVYSLPLQLYGELDGAHRGGAHITPLQTKLLPWHKTALQNPQAEEEQQRPRPRQALQPLSSSILEDAAVDVQRPLCQSVFFSVVDARPSRARIIPVPPGAGSRLGPDDIQIARHELSWRHDDGQTGFISISSASVTSNPVDVLCCLGHTVARTPTSLLCWKVTRQIYYVLDGMPHSNPDFMQVVCQTWWMLRRLQAQTWNTHACPQRWWRLTPWQHWKLLVGWSV